MGAVEESLKRLFNDGIDPFENNCGFFMIEVSRNHSPDVKRFIRFSKQLSHAGEVDLRSCQALLYFEMRLP